MGVTQGAEVVREGQLGLRAAAFWHKPNILASLFFSVSIVFAVCKSESLLQHFF